MCTKLDEYQSEVREISTSQEEPVDTLIQASKLTRRAQARILKVLSENTREDGIILFVDLAEVAKKADMEYSAVSHHTRLLDLGGFVDRDTYGQKKKLNHRNAFEKFCESRMVNPESILY